MNIKSWQGKPAWLRIKFYRKSPPENIPDGISSFESRIFHGLK